MENVVEKIIREGIIPAHAPSWAKMSDAQWIEKLDAIIKYPEKFRKSALKTVLLEAIKK